MDGTILGKKYDIINGEGGGGKLTPATADTLGGIKVGEGLEVTEDGTLSVDFPPEPEPYTAGEYIDITENVVSLDRFLPYVGNNYKITSYDTSGEAKIKVTKYEGESVVSETIVNNHDVSQPRVFDDRFSIQYSNNWIYKNIVASNDHPVKWTKTWGFDQSVNFTERFDNSGEAIALVKQVNAIKNAIISASSFTDAQSKLAQL